VVDHLHDRLHAPPGLADEPAECAVELDFARRVGAVPELVLEPLDAKDVAAAVR
jgi:hypothetical protein